MESLISELCYKGTILQKEIKENYHSMVIS